MKEVLRSYQLMNVEKTTLVLILSYGFIILGFISHIRCGASVIYCQFDTSNT